MEDLEANSADEGLNELFGALEDEDNEVMIFTQDEDEEDVVNTSGEDDTKLPLPASVSPTPPAPQTRKTTAEYDC